MKTRYFHFPKQDRGGTKRVVVFLDGNEPGHSFWADGDKGDKGLSWWTLKDMETEGAKEIIRAKALRMVKNLPDE